jgi:hypothetical protein
MRQTNGDGYTRESIPRRNAHRVATRERYHAAIAYSRPVGNRDPDDDSSTATILSLPRITVY